MEQVARRHLLADAQAVADVAAYASALVPAQPPTVGDGLDLQRGALIYAQRCAACHGPAGVGVAANMAPRLAGQHASYLTRQMQESAGSGRPNMSAAHVELLNQLDVQAYRSVADYLARTVSR